MNEKPEQAWKPEGGADNEGAETKIAEVLGSAGSRYPFKYFLSITIAFPDCLHFFGATIHRGEGGITIVGSGPWRS